MHFHLWKRREFITLLGGAAAAWPLAAWGQPKRPLIAVLVVSAASSVSPRINGFRQALQELGYVEGRELDIAPRYGDGLQARLPALAEELVKLRPSVFVTGSVPATVAAKGASATVPTVGLCGLTEDEVLAIAEHEHLPEIAATALAQYLLSQEHGSEKIRDMIVDDIRQAQLSGDKERVLTLLHVLRHFLKTHPDARSSDHPWSKRV